MNWDNDKGMVLSGFFAVIAALLSIYFTYQNAYAAGLAQKNLQSGIDNSNEIAGNTSDNVVDLQAKNKELNRQVSYLTQANGVLEANITGGNSSCYLQLLPNRDKGVAEVYLIQRGDYPLREVDIEIRNSIDTSKYEKHFGIIKVKKDRRFLTTVPFTGRPSLYTIFISTFNNSWSEQVVIDPSGSRTMGLMFYSVYRLYQIDRNNKYEYSYKFLEQGCFTCMSDLFGNPYVLKNFPWENFKTHLTEFGLIEMSFKTES